MPVAARAFARAEWHRGEDHRVQQPEGGESEDEAEDDHGDGEATLDGERTAAGGREAGEFATRGTTYAKHLRPRFGSIGRCEPKP